MTHLFFDLDGTLTDPKIGITTSIQHALRKLGAPVPDMGDLLWCIGPPLRESFAKILHVTDDATLDLAIMLYRERFSDIGKFENAVYDGIPALLTRLRSQGYSLYLATSKPRIYAEDILTHFQLSAHFSEIFGSELDGRLCDKKELIAHILASRSLDPACCMMIGDREHDILGAKANAITSMGVTYGYGTRQELSKAGADYIVETPEDLYQTLLNISRN